MKKKVTLIFLVVSILAFGLLFAHPLTFVPDGIEGIREGPKPTRTKDLESLKQKNPDVYAWIYIPGTRIDYPLLCSTDTEDGYYLSHDVDRDENIYGALYTEKWNGKELTSLHTIIYGHNMRDGSMFGSLKDYKDFQYFQTHDVIKIETEEKVLTYRIVAAYPNSSEYLPEVHDFQTEEGMASYCGQIPGFVQNAHGNLVNDAEIKAPVLTLSTCESGEGDLRYLVQAVLVKEETF